MSDEEETYRITTKGALFALKAEAYMMKGHSLEETAKLLEMDQDSLRVLLAIMPNVTISELGVSPDEIIQQPFPEEE